MELVGTISVEPSPAAVKNTSRKVLRRCLPEETCTNDRKPDKMKKSKQGAIMKSKVVAKAKKKTVLRKTSKAKPVQEKRIAAPKERARVTTPKNPPAKPEPQINTATNPPNQNPFVEAMRKMRERERSAFAQQKGPQAKGFRRGKFSGFGGRRAA